MKPHAATLSKLEDVRMLVDSGESPERIAQRVGMSLYAVARMLARHAPDIATPFAAAAKRYWRSLR